MFSFVNGQSNEDAYRAKDLWTYKSFMCSVAGSVHWVFQPMYNHYTCTSKNNKIYFEVGSLRTEILDTNTLVSI